MSHEGRCSLVANCGGRRVRLRAALGAVMLSQSGFSSNAFAQQLAPMGQDAGLAELRRAVVSIQVETADGTYRGSGLVLSSLGVIATAAHVLDRAVSVKVRTQAGITLPSDGWLHLDTALDLALIKVDASGLPVATLGTNARLDVGTRLFGVGSPAGLDQTVADGVLSAVRQTGDRTVMQVSIPVSPGSSGGPIATPDGRVVGLVISGIRGGGVENLNFALPISYAVAAMDITANRTPRPWDGARTTIETAKPESAPSAGVSLRRPAGVPARVNDSLDLDWEGLGGAVLLTERRPTSDLVRYDETVSYSVLPDQFGVPTIERRSVVAIMSGDGPYFTTWRKWAESNNRSTLQFLAGGNSAVYFRGPANLTNANAIVEQELAITDTVAEYRVNGSLVDRSWVPRGVIPDILLSAAIAALRGPIPATSFIWTVGVDSENRIAIRSTRLRRLAPSRSNVPVAREGAECSVRGTVRTPLELVEVEVTQGASTFRHTRLMASPHLLVDRDLKCLKAVLRRP